MTHADTEAALLRAVLCDPADDLPRLALADWWEERGEGERAEFVRVQLELAGLSQAERMVGTCGGYYCDVDDGHEVHRGCLFDRLRCRSDVLLPVVTGRWGCRLLPEVASDWQYCRGFVAQVALPLAQFMEHAEAMFRAHPIEEVRLTDREPRRDSIVGSKRRAWMLSYVEGEPDASQLPDAIFDRLEEMTTCQTDTWNLGIAVYPDLAAALDALSRACVAWGRKLAKLPPLESQSPQTH